MTGRQNILPQKGMKIMKDKRAKNTRTLDMYVRLCEGKAVNKAEEALRCGVDERSIQRDIDDIRAFLAERSSGNSSDQRTVVYDRIRKGFVMEGSEASMLTNSEILAVSKILLESRAFTKKEIRTILDKLVAGCVPQKNMKLVADLLANEKYHYVELHHRSVIKDKLWALGSDVKQCNLIEIVYDKQVSRKEKIRRVVEPAAVLFSEYYFYLIAFIVEKDGHGKYVRKFDFPAAFRVDRIRSYKETGEKFWTAYAGRFEEGEFRKRIQFMYAGNLLRLQIRYSGRNVEAVLDRLPTAQIVSQEDDGSYIVEAEVYGKGILMWLLSQGPSVEVLRPESVRRDMKELLTKVLAQYE